MGILSPHYIYLYYSFISSPSTEAGADVREREKNVANRPFLYSRQTVTELDLFRGADLTKTQKKLRRFYWLNGKIKHEICL